MKDLFLEVPSKIAIECKKGMYFSFDYGWYSSYPY